MTADGRRAVAVSWDDTLRVWDLDSGRELHTLHSQAEEVSAMAVTEDGQRAVAGAQDGTLKVWDLENSWDLEQASEQASITLDAQAFCLALAPDNTTIVAGDASGDVHCLRFTEPFHP